MQAKNILCLLQAKNTLCLLQLFLVVHFALQNVRHVKNKVKNTKKAPCLYYTLKTLCVYCKPKQTVFVKTLFSLMYKMKKSYYYLERGFPENLEPAFTNKSTKRKRFLVERKRRILKRAIRKGCKTLVKPFFFSTHSRVVTWKIKNSLSRRFEKAIPAL